MRNLRFSLLLAGLSLLGVTTTGLAQDEPLASESAASRLADRYLQILLRRPSAGTSLDKVYEFHRNNGSLDDLIARLGQTEGLSGEQAGQQLFAVGLLQLKRRAPEAAREALQAAEESLPDDALVSYHLGQAHALAGDQAAALAAYQRAVDRNPPRTAAADLFLELGEKYQRLGQNDKADAVWVELTDRFPDDRRLGERIARIQAASGALPAAIQRFQSLAEAARTAGDIEKGIELAIEAADLQSQNGETDAARAALESLLGETRPGSWLHEDLQNRIERILQEGDDAAALIDFYQAQVAQHPDAIATQLRYAQTLSRFARYRQAAEVYRQAIDRAPSNIEARRGLISVQLASGETTAALKQYRSLAEIDPQNPEHFLRWGELVLRDDNVPVSVRHDRAAEIWNRLATQTTDNAITLTQVAQRLRDIGHDDEALQLYERAIDLVPDQTEYREALGEYLFQLQRTEDAIAACQQMASGERETLPTLVRLAEVLASFGLTEPMVAAIERTAPHDPSFEHRLQFATMLTDAARHDQAFAQLQQAEELAETAAQRERLLQTEIDLLTRSGRLPTAIDRGEAELADGNGDAAAQRRLALLQQSAGRWLAALETISQAVERSPQDIPTLTTAAAIYEEAFQLEEAVAALLRLSELDRSARFQHLTKIAQLQLRLGQIEQALATAKRRIDENPNSVASYQAFAELCFAAARDEQAIEALRDALHIDPRNDAILQQLATTLAEQYQTAEAIELYWRAFDMAPDFESRLDIVGRLTLLHQRTGQFSALLKRLRTRPIAGQETDPSETDLLVAAATEAAGDTEVALQQLIDDSKSKVPQANVLERIVQLAVLADEPMLAIDYQRRLLELQDDAQNQRQLLFLALQCEDAESRHNVVQRLAGKGKSQIVVDAIDETLRRGNFILAEQLGDALLAATDDGSRFSVQLRLAIAACGAGHTDKTEPLIAAMSNQIAEGDFVWQTLADPTEQGSATAALTPRQAALLFAPQLASLLDLGAPRRCPIVDPTSQPFDPQQLRTPQELGWFVETLALANAAKQQNLQDRYQSLHAGRSVASRPDQRATDADAAWSALLRAQAYAIFRNDREGSAPRDRGQTDWQRHLWNLVQAGDSTALECWLTWLRNRQTLRQGDSDDRDRLQDSRFTSSQLDWLATGAFEPLEPLTLAAHVAIYGELVWEDRQAAAETYIQGARLLSQSVTFGELLDAQQFFLEIGKRDRAVSLAAALRDRLSESDRAAEPPQLDRLEAQAVRASRLATEDVRWELLRLMMLAEQLRMEKVPAIPSASESTETLMVYRDQDGQSTLQNVAGPISTRMVRPAFLESLYEVVINAASADESSAQRLAKQLQDLDTQSSDGGETSQRVSDENQRTARFADVLPSTAAFFIHTWVKDWEAAAESLAALQWRIPTSPDLQLEQARLLETRGRRDEALTLLAEIQPADPQTLQKRDLRMLRLASYAGRPNEAQEAANRLSVMPLDAATQLTLVGQLKRMGLDELGDAVLQRVRRQSVDDSRTLLDVAFAYERQGRADAAAEAAFDVIRRDREKTAPSAEMIRAVRLLHSLDRLDRTIFQLEQRAEAAGDPVPLLRQLSKIYQASGMHDKMLAVEAKVTEREPDNAAAQSQLASLYVSTHRYSAAVDRFLLAFRIDPSLIDSSWRDFERAVQMSDRADEVLSALLEIGLDRLPPAAVQQLMRFSLSADRSAAADPWNDAKQAFYSQLLAQQDATTFVKSLATVRHRAGAATTQIAAAPLRSILQKPSHYRADSPLWKPTSPIKSGVFPGALPAILDTLNDEPELRDAVHQTLAAPEFKAPSQATLDAFLAALKWEMGDQQQGAEQLMATLQSPGSSLAPGLIWQIAQRWQSAAAANTAVQAMDQWLREAPLPAAWRSFPDGLDRRLLDRQLDREEYTAAAALLRQRFRELCPACQLAKATLAESTDGLDTATLDEAKFIARRLRELQRPIDAARIYRGLLRRLQPQRFDFPRQPVLRQASLAVRKLSDELQEAANEWAAIDALDSADLMLQQLLFEANGDRYCDLLVNVPEPWSVDEITSLTTQLLERLAKTAKGKEQLKDCLLRIESDETLKWAQPMRLALRSLLALQLQHGDSAALVSELTAAIEEDPAIPPRALLQFTLVAKQACESIDPQATTEGRRLASELLKHAMTAGADSHLVYLSRLLIAGDRKGQDAESRQTPVVATLRRRLDEIAPRRKTPLALDIETAALALEISELALTADDLPLSLEAASRALAGGPPLHSQAAESELTGLDLGAGDLYRRTQDPGRLVSLAIASLSQRWLLYAAIAGDRESSAAIAQTMLTIAFPATQPQQLQLYRVATMGTPFQFSAADPRPPSLVVPLLQRVASEERLATIRKRLDGLPSIGEDASERTTSRLLLAQWSEDHDRALKIAEDLVEEASLPLPTWQAMLVFQLPSKPFTPTFAKKELAGQKLALADRLLLLLPDEATTDEHGSQENAGSWAGENDRYDRLSLRVAGMLMLDQEASRHVLPQLDWIVGRIHDRAVARKTSETATVASRLQAIIRDAVAEEAR